MIKLDKLEYLPKEHLYIYNGELLPSVTEILQIIFKDKYSNIPEFMLEKAKIKGTNIHNAIENYIETKEISEEYINQVNSFITIIEEQGFEVVDKEKMIVVLNNNKPIICGRFDLLVRNKNGKLYVVDIKTTSKIDEDYLGYQLNTYKKGIQDTLGYEVDFLGCIWLRDKKKKYVEIRVDKSKLDEILFLSNLNMGEYNE